MQWEAHLRLLASWHAGTSHAAEDFTEQQSLLQLILTAGL